MAIHLKIGAQAYKLPDRITVGRGSPFTQFDEDRSVARSHLKLVRKNDAVYVKDLGGQAGTYLDGRRIPKKKFVKWPETSELRMGNHPLSLLPGDSDRDPASTTINVRTIRNQVSSSSITRSIYTLLLALGIIYIWFFPENDTTDEKIFSTIVMTLASLMLYFWSTLIKKFTRRFIAPNQEFTKIYLSEHGFTAHYDSGGSMTVELSHITTWKKSGQALKIRTLHGAVHSYPCVPKLIKLLSLEIPDKEEQGSWPEKHGYRGLIIVGAIFWFLQDYIEPTTFVLLVGMSFVVVLVASFSTMKGKWVTQNRHQNSKQRIVLATFLIALSLLSAFLPEKSQKRVPAAQSTKSSP